MERWFQVTTHNACFGFAINEKNIVTKVAPIAYDKLFGKSVRDPEIRKWFIDNNYLVTEIKT